LRYCEGDRGKSFLREARRLLKELGKGQLSTYETFAPLPW